MEIQSAKKFTIEEIMFEYMKECGEYPQFVNKTLKDVKRVGVIERGEIKSFEAYKSRIQRVWDGIRKSFIPEDIKHHLVGDRGEYEFLEEDKEFIKELFKRYNSNLWKYGLRKIKDIDKHPSGYPDDYDKIANKLAIMISEEVRDKECSEDVTYEELFDVSFENIYKEIQWVINGFKDVFKRRLNEKDYESVKVKLETYRGADMLDSQRNPFVKLFGDEDQFWEFIKKEKDSFVQIKVFE